MLSHDEQELYTKAFLQCYRGSDWTQGGTVAGTRARPMVAGTVRQAAGHLAAAFRDNLRPSPIHIKGGSNLRPFVRSLLKAYENDDPPSNQQRAITPKLLRAMYHTGGVADPATRDTKFAIIAELAIMAYFWAMRSCEFTLTPTPGKTRIIRVRGIVFQDRENNELDHQSGALEDAVHVTITFEDQKNGVRMESRTHEKSGDPILCPVLRTASLMNRIYRRLPTAGPDTPINATFISSTRSEISSSALRTFIRSICTLNGGKKTFGYNASDLGRWKSEAFLVYIRPQVLKWTHSMLTNMITHDPFLDAAASRKTQPSDPLTRRRLFNGDPGKREGEAGLIKMHLHH